MGARLSILVLISHPMRSSLGEYPELSGVRLSALHQEFLSGSFGWKDNFTRPCLNV